MKKLLIILTCLLVISCSKTSTRVDVYENIVGTYWSNNLISIKFFEDNDCEFITPLDTFRCAYVSSQNFVSFFYKKQVSTLIDSYIEYAKIKESTLTLYLMMPDTNEWSIKLIKND